MAENKLSAKAQEVISKLLSGEYYLRYIKTKRWIGIRLMQYAKPRDKRVEEYEAHTDAIKPIAELDEAGYLRYEGDGTFIIPSMAAMLQKVFDEVEVPTGHTLRYDGQVKHAEVV